MPNVFISYRSSDKDSAEKLADQIRAAGHSVWLDIQSTNRLAEAEPLMRRALAIFLDFSHRTGHEHPHQKEAVLNYKELSEIIGLSDSGFEAMLKLFAEPPE